MTPLAWVGIAVVAAFLALFFIALYIDYRRARYNPSDGGPDYDPFVPPVVIPTSQPRTVGSMPNPAYFEQLEPWLGKATSYYPYHPEPKAKPKEAA